MTVQAISSNNSYDVTVNGETTRVTGASAKVYNDLSVNASTFTFTINSVSSTVNWLAVRSLTLTLVEDPVLVTYALYESDGETLVSNTVVSQEKNSAVSIPSGISNYTYYDYLTEGTISDSDCTIKVTRTLKSGVVIALNGLSNDKCYTIRNNRGAWAVASGATEVNSTNANGLNLQFSKDDTKQQFAFITYEGNVYLYSVSESKFVYINGTKLSLTAGVTSNVESSPVTFTASTASDATMSPILMTIEKKYYGIHPSVNPNVYNYQYANDNGNVALIEEATSFDAKDALAALDAYFHPSYTVTYVVQDGYNNTLFTSDPVGTELGTTFTTLPAEYQLTNFYTYNSVDVTINTTGNTEVVFKATPKETPLVRYTADASNPYYYNLNIRSKYLVYKSDATGEVTLQETSEPFNPDASWAFIGEPYAGFKVINKTKGVDNYLTYTSVVTGSNHGNNNIGFVANADFTNQYWNIDKNSGGIVLRMRENPNIYFHHDNGKNFLRTCSLSEWTDVHNDAGSTIVAATDEGVLEALYVAMSERPYGTGYGKFNSTNTSVATNDVITAKLSEVGTDLQNSNTANYKADYDALMSYAGIIEIVTPAPGYYRLKNISTDKYLRGTAVTGYANNTKAVFADGDANTVETVIALVENGGNLYMYNQGYGFGWTIADKEYGAGLGYLTTIPDKYVHWFPGNADDQVAFAICYGNGEGSYSSYLMKGIYTVDTSDNSVIGGTDATIDAAQWVVEKVTDLTVTLHDGGDGKCYATLCVPFDVTITGADAYTLAKSDKGDWLTPTKVDEVPAGTPVLLKGDNPTATATINTGEAFNGGIKLDCVLTGTYFAIDIDEEAPEYNNYYVLGSLGEGVGFYNEWAHTLGANRAYYDALANPGIKGFAINWGETDGIENMRNGENETMNSIFNLNGQRVGKAQKGIYIVNGKKTVIK